MECPFLSSSIIVHFSSKTPVIISLFGVPLFSCRWLIFTILHISKVILKFCYGDGALMDSLILFISQICCISNRKPHILVRWLVRHFGPYSMLSSKSLKNDSNYKHFWSAWFLVGSTDFKNFIFPKELLKFWSVDGFDDFVSFS